MRRWRCRGRLARRDVAGSAGAWAAAGIGGKAMAPWVASGTADGGDGRRFNRHTGRCQRSIVNTKSDAHAAAMTRRASRLRARRLRIEDRYDACTQRRAMRHADRSARRSAHAAHVCGDVQQELRVVGRHRTGAQYRVVARTLLQAADSFGREPHERVVPMQRARESRYESAESVATLDMCELVQQRSVSRRFRPGIARSRQQQHRPHHAPRARARDVLRFEHAHRR